MATSPELRLKEGDLAPAFSALSHDGIRYCLEELRGKTVILYFYPRDNTPGCTKEACGFRDEFTSFKEKGAVVLGISSDSAESHVKFARKHKLPFPLLIDTDKTIAQAYGAWGEKKFLGRRYMGMHRFTFLIGPDGRIKKIWTKVKPEQHAEQILSQL